MIFLEDDDELDLKLYKIETIPIDVANDELESINKGLRDFEEGKFIPTKPSGNSMKNTYRIVWSEEALANLKAIIEYIEKNWAEKELKKFAKLLDNRLSLIAKNPLLFPAINHPKSLRRILLPKFISIFYQPFDGYVRIVSLFDNRRNPEQIKKL
jgi:plasmid stabilization system protein ParE